MVRRAKAKAKRRTRAGARSARYGEDLAAIHDAGFGDLARRAARSLLEILAARGEAPGLVVDLGCGSGILAQAIADSGRPVLGVDLSPAMIALARARAPRARFLVGSIDSFEMPPCAAVTAVGECFSYLGDGRIPDRKLARVFRRIHRALQPGGIFLFDVAAFGRVVGPGSVQTHREGDGWAVLVRVEADATRRLLTRRITSFRRTGDRFRRSFEVHHLRLFLRSEVAGMLRGAGFEVRPLARYGDLDFPRGHIGFLARKPGASSARRASSLPSRHRTSRGRPREAPPR
jgi:SAM-dependent methyltransferase